jgi:DDE_Tnp_1-associated
MTFETTAQTSLWGALKAVPDHRRAEGRRYSLASLLLVAIAAMLAGRRDQLGIIRWGRKLSREALASIGIARSRIPAPSVWCELFRDLDIAALERALGAWVRGAAPPGHMAIDGKRLRGSATATSPGVHLLAAFSSSLEGVIDDRRG